MGSRELRQKYGAPNTRKAINRAIRAECPNGAALIELVHQAYCKAEAAGWWVHDAATDELKPSPEADDHDRAITQLRALELVIRKRYGMPLRTSI